MEQQPRVRTRRSMVDGRCSTAVIKAPCKRRGTINAKHADGSSCSLAAALPDSSEASARTGPLAACAVAGEHRTQQPGRQHQHHHQQQQQQQQQPLRRESSTDDCRAQQDAAATAAATAAAEPAAAADAPGALLSPELAAVVAATGKAHVGGAAGALSPVFANDSSCGGGGGGGGDAADQPGQSSQQQQQQRYIKGTRLIIGGWFQACRGCNEPTAHSRAIAGRDVPFCPRCGGKFEAMSRGDYPPRTRAPADASVEPLSYWLPRLMGAMPRVDDASRRRFCDQIVLRQDDAWRALISASGGAAAGGGEGGGAAAAAQSSPRRQQQQQQQQHPTPCGPH